MRRPRLPSVLTASLLLGATLPHAPAQDPDRLALQAPIETWDEAIPLGNGLTGGLLWGADNAISLSLDRGDLWDERLPDLYRQPNWTYATIRELQAAGNQAEITRLFDRPYSRVPYPTKLPGGRLVLTLEPARRAEVFELDLRQALGRVRLTDGTMDCFFSATQPVAMLRVPGAVTCELRRPRGLDRLGYQPAQFGRADGLTWMVQHAAEGLTYAVVVASQHVEGTTFLAVAITSNQDGDDPLAIGKRRVRTAIDTGFDASFAAHRRWWADFWAVSEVNIPSPRLQRHYNLVKYFYGAASRRGAPPMPLQAVWTRDDGGLPPWKGDFHHDLNTQMTYLAYHAAGLTQAGLSFIDYNWQRLPVYRRFAREFYGVAGAAVPGVATLAGKATAGWSQYALSPTNGLWVGQTFYLHWRYTMDREFLANRAYPWLSEVATGIVDLLQDKDGELVLPLSSSPEIHKNSLRAWLKPNSNYDQSLMHWAFGALAEMADALDRASDARRWRRLRDRLGGLHVDQQDVLMFARGEPMNQSHRHHSHTMAIHPLATLNIDGGARDRAIIAATLDRVHAKGTQQWTGYSFSWFASLLARAGRAELALRYLTDYERAFTLRNGFHVNGDQLGAGLSRYRYRPFTLEGNFLAMEAVHDMLLQSWGERIRVFPAVSKRWVDVSFCDLRAQGGFKVSAERRGGRTVRVVVTATVDSLLRLVDPFAGAPVDSNLQIDRSEGELRCRMQAGQTLELQPPSHAMVSLAGAWRFRLDPEGVGESGRWFAAALGDESIALPGTTDLAGKGYTLDPATMTYPVAHLKSGIKYSQGVERLDRVGYLVRKHLYIGKAWYQRQIEIPDRLVGKRLQLYLERVNWQSTVWLDGERVGSCDSLVAGHRFDLGWARPGSHRLTICVDNDLVHNIGIVGHAYGPETQTRWNGIVGRIELRAVDATGRIWIEDVQVYPDVAARVAKVVMVIRNLTGAAGHGSLTATARSDHSTVPHAPAMHRTTFRFGGDQRTTVRFDYPMGAGAQLWDEFQPTRYALSIRMNARTGDTDHAHRQRVVFGMRSIARNGRHLEVNGRRVFLRGTLDCCVYPETGHPPVTVPEWLRVLGTIRQHGFNHVRFHTWCPPDAAFEAADRLGIYLAPETPFWVDDWVADTPPKPRPLGRDPRVTRYVRDEIRRLCDAYGNHPSFALFCIGNEFGHRGTDWKLVDELLAEARRHDPRRVYNATTARKRVPADDLWVTHSTGAATRGVGPPHTDWDFAAAVARTDLPVVAHETGQRPVFPDYDDLLPKFTGPLQPANLARLRRMAIDHGLADQITDFERASARFQLVQYKAEHEAMRRTADLAGYQLLMLNDFTGQSEAHVGVLDPFWDSKGVVDAADVRQWNSPTVLLARFARYTWTDDQTFAARLQVAHHGAEALSRAVLTWSLATRDGQTLARGETDPVDVPRGTVVELGRIAVPLQAVQRATALTLDVTLGAVANRWPIWVYPVADDDAGSAPAGIIVTRTLDDEASQSLNSGGRVLLLAHGITHARAAKARNGFESVYWSGGWWGDGFSQLGIHCDPAHPALADFPTAGHSDWQWRGLTHTATTFDLTGLLPAGYRPVVQAVPDFHHNRLLGHVFEIRVGEGRVLVCGYDLSHHLQQRHAARQLRGSLLRYMRSAAFAPQTRLTLEQLTRLVPPRIDWGATLRRLGAVATASSGAGSHPASHAIDGDPRTIWHTPWQSAAPVHPHALILDLAAPRRVAGLLYLPRQDQANGRIKAWSLHASDDGEDWGEPIASGTWPAGTSPQTVDLATPVTRRYLKLIARSEVHGNAFAAVAEVEVILE